MPRHYYAGHSYMGTRFTYDSPCWVAYAFDSQRERDTWLREHEYEQCTGNYVAEAISRGTAYRIAGISRYQTATIDSETNRLEGRY